MNAFVKSKVGKGSRRGEWLRVSASDAGELEPLATELIARGADGEALHTRSRLAHHC